MDTPKTKKRHRLQTSHQKPKKSRNIGEWDSLSSAQQQRYFDDAPSPDPLLQSLQTQAALRETSQKLTTLTVAYHPPNQPSVPSTATITVERYLELVAKIPSDSTTSPSKDTEATSK